MNNMLTVLWNQMHTPSQTCFSLGKSEANLQRSHSYHVSTESLYGMYTCFFFGLDWISDNIDMTFPSVCNDLLIQPPSYEKKLNTAETDFNWRPFFQFNIPNHKKSCFLYIFYFSWWKKVSIKMSTCISFKLHIIGE